MSRSIHKTAAQVARQNAKSDLAAPDHPDVAALAQKLGYKRAKRSERREKNPEREPRKPESES